MCCDDLSGDEKTETESADAIERAYAFKRLKIFADRLWKSLGRCFGLKSSLRTCRLIPSS
jgi:hypothetical protein